VTGRRQFGAPDVAIELRPLPDKPAGDAIGKLFFDRPIALKFRKNFKQSVDIPGTFLIEQPREIVGLPPFHPGR
jgi:hypothetical protein